jgi:hypothetical protein
MLNKLTTARLLIEVQQANDEACWGTGNNLRQASRFTASNKPLTQFSLLIDGRCRIEKHNQLYCLSRYH